MPNPEESLQLIHIMFMIEAKFLAIAVEHRLLTKYQAIEAASIQNQYILHSAMIPVPKVGEICIDRLFMTLDEVKRVISSLSTALEKKSSHKDPLRRSFIDGIGINFSLDFGTTVGFIIFVIICSIAFFHKDVTTTAGYASILGLLLTIFVIAFPQVLRKIIPINFGLLTKLIGILLIASAVVIIGFIDYQLLSDGQDFQVIPISEARILILLSWLTLLGCFLAIYIKLKIRRSEIYYLEMQNNLLSALGSRIQQAVYSDDFSIKDLASDILYTSARAMQLNPWNMYLKRFLFWRKDLGSTSVWLMIPSNTDENRFDIRLIAMPEAPDVVTGVLKDAEKEYHPVKFDSVEYNKALSMCRDGNGKLNRHKYKALSNRNSFVSLTGFVFDQKRAQFVNRISDCLAYDDSYEVKLRERHISKQALRWIDFKCVAAYPINKKESLSPIGVLIALENVVNGITQVDRRTLAVASRFLGIIFMAPNGINDL